MYWTKATGGLGSLADTSRIGHNQPVVLTRTGHSGPTHPLLI